MRIAKTAAEHWRDGTLSQVGREKPVRVTASQFQSGRPKFPKHLSKIARHEYKRVCKFLADRRTLSDADFYTISVLAEVYARWISAKGSLGVEFTITTTILDKKGNASTVTRENPLCKIVSDCESKILALSKALGLTPADRDRVKQLQNGANEDEIIPGSMADLHPEWFERPKLEVVNGVAGYTQPAAVVDPAEMPADDEPPDEVKS
jgi:P27 family predicted phage terminase small subunit